MATAGTKSSTRSTGPKLSMTFANGYTELRRFPPCTNLKEPLMTDDTRADWPKELKASSALIVGGTAGIGLASARALAQAGVPRIAIVGRNAERGQLAAKSVAELGAAVQFIAGDAVDPDAAATVAAEADQVLSGIDILMCSTAADVRPELFVNIPTHDIGRGLTQLALPSMHMAGAVLPGMRSRRGGVII